MAFRVLREQCASLQYQKRLEMKWPSKCSSRAQFLACRIGLYPGQKTTWFPPQSFLHRKWFLSIWLFLALHTVESAQSKNRCLLHIRLVMRWALLVVPDLFNTELRWSQYRLPLSSHIFLKEAYVEHGKPSRYKCKKPTNHACLGVPQVRTPAVLNPKEGTVQEWQGQHGDGLHPHKGSTFDWTLASLLTGLLPLALAC